MLSAALLCRVDEFNRFQKSDSFALSHHGLSHLTAKKPGFGRVGLTCGDNLSVPRCSDVVLK